MVLMVAPLLFLLVIGWLIFSLLIFPTWMLFHCIGSTRLSRKAKTGWTIALAVIWPIASWVYALFVSRRPLFKWLGGSSAISMVLLLAGLIAAMPLLASRAEEEMSRVMERFNRLDPSSLPEEQREQLRSGLLTLRQEWKQGWPKDPEKLRRCLGLYELLDLYAKDQRLTEQEIQDWTSKFNGRQVLDSRALREQVLQLRRK